VEKKGENKGSEGQVKSGDSLLMGGGKGRRREQKQRIRRQKRRTSSITTTRKATKAKKGTRAWAPPLFVTKCGKEKKKRKKKKEDPPVIIKDTKVPIPRSGGMGKRGEGGVEKMTFHDPKGSNPGKKKKKKKRGGIPPKRCGLAVFGIRWPRNKKREVEERGYFHYLS